MKICGIISEYNPFHNGHEYMIRELREGGATHIVAVMSGNYVQRSEPAIISKYARAEAALKCGIDLVIELPTIYATATAERFARGGVALIDSLGCVSDLGFGCENDNVELLCEAADIVLSNSFSETLKKHLKNGNSFPSARELAVNEIASEEISNLLKSPNNILAIEYIKACKNLKADLKFNAVKRVGAEHDSDRVDNGFMSASKIRELILKSHTGIEAYVPEKSFEIIKREIEKGRAPVSYKDLETAVLAKMRSLKPSEYLNAPDVSEGIENRLYDAVRTATSLEELFETAKTKRYTHSRIRRIVLSVFLDITKEDVTQLPPYIKVLGLNENGKEILRQAKTKAKLPIVMKSADISGLDKKCKDVFEKEAKATDIYSLAMPKTGICGMEMTEEVIVL